MTSLHLFWFAGWNVVAVNEAGDRAKLLGRAYTKSRKVAEGLFAAQLRKYVREEGGVIEGAPLYMPNWMPAAGDRTPLGYASRIPKDTQPFLGDQAPMFDND